MSQWKTYIDPRSNLHDGNDAPTSVEKGSALNLFTSHFNQSFPPLASERLLEKNMLWTVPLSYFVLRRKGHICCLMFTLPDILGATYSFYREAPLTPRTLHYPTRTVHSAPYRQLHGRTYQYLYSFFPHAISLWNNLPSSTVIYLMYTILMRQCT